MAYRLGRLKALLAVLLPLGSAGASSALAASSSPAAADAVTPSTDVASRLAAVREAVSRVVVDDGVATGGEAPIEKAWWGNWHRGWGWHNGGWGWRNGGGGWGNGGWPNWHNGWGNGGWRNFWRNW